MTDQFSQEYIAFILSDEAKRLQNAMGWAKKGGWILINGKPELVTEVDDYVATYKANGIWRGQEEWPKVPGLFDLLQIIEGAGWEWSRRPNRWEGWKPADANIGDAVKEWAIIENTEDMLAAAKLTVRAIGGKKCGLI